MTQIRTLEDIESAMIANRALIAPKHPGWNRPRPAAFIINLSGYVLLGMIRSGLFVFEKEAK